MEIEWRDGEHGRGYSAALGLYVCWEREERRFYDPQQGLYRRARPLTDARRRAEARAEAAEARLAELGREGGG